MKKMSSEELVKRLKSKVYLAPTDELTTLFGEPVQIDDEGRKYVVFPAYEELKQIVTDLHPNWELASDFIDMSGLEDTQAPSKVSLSESIAKVADKVR